GELVARDGAAHRREPQLDAPGRRGEARDRGRRDQRRRVPRGPASRRRRPAQPGDDAARIRAPPIAAAASAITESATNASESQRNAVPIPAASAIAPKIGAATPPTG